jgi:hypothetical protein
VDGRHPRVRRATRGWRRRAGELGGGKRQYAEDGAHGQQPRRAPPERAKDGTKDRTEDGARRVARGMWGWSRDFR